MRNESRLLVAVNESRFGKGGFIVNGDCMAASINVAVTSGARVRIVGLKARPELNGSLGTVESVNEDTGRYNVLIDDMREALALKLEALEVAEEFGGFVIGSRVRIADVEKKPELNGQLGTVEGFYGKRCIVYVEKIREKVQIMPTCLAIADERSQITASIDVAEGVVVRVECNSVMLKLTLSEKQMSKPLAEAIIKPFLKAYSKKKGGAEVTVKDVSQVTVDSDGQTSLKVLNDIHIFSAEQCFKGLEGNIDVDIRLKGDDMPTPPAPKPVASTRLPKDARVLIHGLTSAAGEQLNGLEGRLSGFHEPNERYEVTLEDGKVVSVRAENLIDLGQHKL